MKVKLPSLVEPFLSIRDFGTGLDDQQMVDVFIAFGNSTKTHSNDFIGGKGIGAKSPLAYGDMFTVFSYQNGYKTMHTIFKDEGIRVLKVHLHNLQQNLMDWR